MGEEYTTSNMKKLIFGTIIGLFAAASVASAAPLTQGQIDAVLGLLRSFGVEDSVIANVQSSLTGKPPSPSPSPSPSPVAWCHSFNVNLKFGDSGEAGGVSVGEDISALFKILSKEGLLDYDRVVRSGSPGTSLRATTFTEDVASAVTAFQEKYRSEILTPNGLTHGTGYVGPATRKKLNQLYGCGVAVKPPTPVSCTEDAKQCPDGSYVGRIAPSCQFAPCPTSDAYIKSLTKDGSMLIVGWVRSDVDGTALAGVKVSSSGGSSVFTNQDGYFEFSFPIQGYKDLPCIGTVATIMFVKDGYRTEKQINTSIWSGGDWILKISLKPGNGEFVRDWRPHQCYGL